MGPLFPYKDGSPVPPNLANGVYLAITKFGKDGKSPVPWMSPHLSIDSSINAHHAIIFSFAVAHYAYSMLEHCSVPIEPVAQRGPLLPTNDRVSRGRFPLTPILGLNRDYF